MDALQITDMDAFVATLVKQVALEMTKQRPPLPIQHQLWNSAACAEFLSQSRRTFVDSTAKQLSFPAPIRVPNAAGRALPIWKALEVIAWADSWKLKSSH